MMKTLILVLLMGIPAVAKSKWSVFKSDAGFMFKYPSCWNVTWDDAEDKRSLIRSTDLFVGEGSSCTTPRLNSYSTVPNGIGISRSDHKKTRLNVLDEIGKRKKLAPNQIAAKRELAFKQVRIGGNDAIADVWVEPGYIHWQFKIFCPKWWISTDGPDIDNKHISKLMREKFKKGDLALPEPYKTIVNSIRCIPPKKK